MAVENYCSMVSKFALKAFTWNLHCCEFVCRLENPNPKTYIGGGKVAELKAAIQAFKVETVIFDDELSPGYVFTRNGPAAVF